MMQALEAVQIIEEIESYEKAIKRIPEHLKDTHPYSAFALWTFYLDTHHTPEGKSCIYCEMFDGQTFTGADLRSVFPDHRWEGDDIYPDVHKTLWGKEGTCACLLIREPNDEAPPNFSLWSGTIGTDWTQTPTNTEEGD